MAEQGVPQSQYLIEGQSVLNLVISVIITIADTASIVINNLAITVVVLTIILAFF